MKKIQIQGKKLQLKKENVANLTKCQMGHVHGGGADDPGGDTAVFVQCHVDAQGIQIFSIGHQCSLDHSCRRVSCDFSCCPMIIVDPGENG